MCVTAGTSSTSPIGAIGSEAGDRDGCVPSHRRHHAWRRIPDSCRRRKNSGYRTRATWHLDPNTGNVGYMAAESHRVVGVEYCPIVEPSLNEALTKTRESIRAGLSSSLVYRAAAGRTARSSFNGIGDPPYL